jgi:ribose 1,5-bisphosphate isomerase
MNLEEAAKKIESMEIRGAAKIARMAAQALKTYVMMHEGNDVEELRNGITEAKQRLISTRPTAVSLRNAVDIVVGKAETAEDIETIRSGIISRADTFVARSKQALDLISTIGSKRIRDGFTVLTHCNSSAAISTIIRAHKDGKSIQVYATESRPKRQGYISVKQLADEGIPTTLIVDSAVRYVMQRVDIVVVGADTIASNGAVINKIGTSQIALCAHEARVPVMVCAETFKFSHETLSGELVEIEEREINEIVDPGDFPGVRIYNPVFDATPPEYIDVIVTEEGVISPHAAYEIIKTMEGKNEYT